MATMFSRRASDSGVHIVRDQPVDVSSSDVLPEAAFDQLLESDGHGESDVEVLGAFAGDDRCLGSPLYEFAAGESEVESWAYAVGALDVNVLYFAGLPMHPVVPYGFRDRWAAANAKVAAWYKNASEGSAERACALKWFVVLHILLLRKPLKSSRGVRRRRDTMRQRFLDFEEGSFACLIRAAMADVRRLGTSRRSTGASSGAAGEAELGERMQRLILGQRSLRRAARLLGGMTLVSGDDTVVAAQVISKHQLGGLVFA